jgi:hypothetical protein
MVLNNLSKSIFAKILFSKKIAVFLLFALISGCVSHKPHGYVKLIDKTENIPENSKLFVKVPKGIATFIGKAADYSGTIDSTAVLYPAVTPIDFFASVIAHAAIVDSMKNDYKNSMQSAADRVIEPYRKYSNSLKNEYLIKKLEEVALSRGFSLDKYENSLSADDYILDITPIFLLNTKEDTLILRNQFLVYKKKYQDKQGKKKPLLFQNQIEVFSSTKDLDVTQQYWLDNEGENLKEEMNQLFSESLQLIASRISVGTESDKLTYKNYRYHDGDGVVFERAVSLNETCDKVVFKTLRGWLKSVPTDRVINHNLCI